MTSTQNLMPDTVLLVDDLSVHIASDAGVVQAVENLSLAIQRGQTFALVGESGSGKSMTALALLRLLPDAGWIESGMVHLGERPINSLPEHEMRRVRGGQIGIIFQEPSTSLNPVMTIGQQLMEVLRAHTPLRGRALTDRAVAWLDRVGIPDAARRLNDYPFQFSGGQKQRIMIAIALAAEPRLLVADEPTTALDVTVQAQILDLLADIQREMGLAILLITHDLAIVRQVADYVALMRAGKVLVTQEVDAFFASPGHEYAHELLAAVPGLEKRGRPLSGVAVARDGLLQYPSVAAQTDVSTPVLQVSNLSVAYRRKDGLFSGAPRGIEVVKDVSFTLHKGETLALLGESGCGKTTVAKTLLRLLDRDARIGGSALLDGQNLLAARGAQLKRLRRSIQIVFQDPYASLDPRMQVGEILDEGLAALKPEQPRADRQKTVRRLLDRVGLPSDTSTRYPHEFSGGQRQRIAIARALALEPSVLVCDEPTSALDVSVQAQLLDLLRELQAEFGMAYLFITHNFGVVEYLADRIAIMHEGRIVEAGDAVSMLKAPQHPQTQRLLAAVPRI
ncbi:MAG TPA: dipeptide ABC transporter ATP-binding protein [Burkholderiaceae bacterium]|nr:dipeptide ABC transporter ATP-binding protein [Burkholderiaceae bacterium]HLU15817.1 dipeptide ABC transporter ATP-binding protein [Burkholderiaceae bacterium]